MARPKRSTAASVQPLVSLQSADDGVSGDSSENGVAAVVSRPKQPPVIASRNRLTVPGLDQEKFYYRWCKDYNDNIPMRLSEGFVFVGKDGKQAGDRDANYSQSNSSLMVRSGGQGLKLYLMCIPKELWEDRQAWGSQKDAKDREDYIKQKVKTGKIVNGRGIT